MKRFSDLVAEIHAEASFRELLPLRRKLFCGWWWRALHRDVSRVWYRFRGILWDKYHLVDMRGEDNYRGGWLDRDAAILLACFKLLRQYVELEDPRVGLDPNRYFVASTEEEREVIAGQNAKDLEIRALYVWWTDERPREQAEDDGSSYERTEALYARDQEMLHRLVVIRGRLWT